MTGSPYRRRLLPDSTRNAIGGILIGAALMALFALHVELEGQRMDSAAASRIVEAQ